MIQTPSAELCSSCASPMADDQRYCLTCGEVRPGARRALPAALRRPPAQEPVVAPVARTALPANLTTGLAALACLLLAIGVGVLIGRGGHEQTAAAPITIAGAAAGALSPPAAPASFTSDWPAGKEGWTIALQSLPKSSSDAAVVTAAKTRAKGKGAPAVGALDSDAYPSLTAGSYVVYSGVFKTRDLAGGALKALKTTFADARIVQVATTTPTAARTTTKTPSQKKKTSAKKSKPAAGSRSDTKSAFEKSKKAPKTVGTGGKPPAKDNKPAAGGGGFQDIG
jgi:hypothetical protein